MKRLILIIACAVSVTMAQAQEKRIMVAYFSATGTTETVAKAIAEATGGTLYRIQPQVAYTSADLDWRNHQSRSSREMADPESRPPLADLNARAADYDVIFLGYPIWWDKCPSIVNTFIEAYALNGKSIIPFATSGSSTIQNSVKVLRELYDKINWQSGKLLNGRASDAAKWATETLKAL